VHVDKFNNFQVKAKRYTRGLKADAIDINCPGSRICCGRTRGDCARDIRQECARLPFPANSLLN